MRNILRKVMKRAWEIKKENAKNIFSMCLKMAWAEIKKGVSAMVEVAKEIRIFYGTYKENRMKAVDESYDNETKTIQVKIEGYAVEYDGIDRRRKFHNKIDELSNVIAPIEGKFDGIHIFGYEIPEKYYIYEAPGRDKIEINVDERKYIIGVPVELIDKFLELEQGKFKKIYAVANDFNDESPAFIEI